MRTTLWPFREVLDSILGSDYQDRNGPKGAEGSSAGLIERDPDLVSVGKVFVLGRVESCGLVSLGLLAAQEDWY